MQVAENKQWPCKKLTVVLYRRNTFTDVAANENKKKVEPYVCYVAHTCSPGIDLGTKTVS